MVTDFRKKMLDPHIKFRKIPCVHEYHSETCWVDVSLRRADVINRTSDQVCGYASVIVA